MNKQARKIGKNKGRKALYFSKWYTPAPTAKKPINAKL